MREDGFIGDWPEGFVPRQLPQLKMGKFDFEVDVSACFIRNPRDIDNVASFLMMENSDGKYQCYIDPFNGKVSPAEVEGFEKFEIDQMVKLDPIGISKKYGVEQSNLPETDLMLVANSQSLTERNGQGKFPILNIAGDEYHVDLRLNELMLTSDPNIKIFLAECNVEDSGELFFLYNFEKRDLVVFDPTYDTRLPRNTVGVLLPSRIILDTVHIVRKQTGDETLLLNACPVQHYFDAKIIHLKDTGYPKMAKNNRDKVKAKQRRKNGRRL